MNPELLRNIWLELTPRRLAIMPVVLAIVLLAPFALPAGQGLRWIGNVAEIAYLALVVVWGTHLAAGAVSGEIRGRTWDGQRLSSMAPWSMTWAKLLGATIYAWYGGAICLAALLAATTAQADLSAAPAQAIRLLAIGLVAQAASLFAAMLFVHKGQAQSRLLAITAQAIGLLAAYLAYHLVVPADWVVGVAKPTAIVWHRWRIAYDGFALASLAALLFWCVIGIHRLLRVELQAPNRPWAWLAFLGFTAVYCAGFADGSVFLVFGLPAGALALAGAAIAAVAYGAAIMEPKDPVRYRRLARLFRERHVAALFADLPRWLFAYVLLLAIVAAMVVIAIAGPPGSEPQLDQAYFAIALSAFVGRDLGLFLLFGLAPEARRADTATAIYLAVLYLALPLLLEPMGLAGLRPLLLPAAEAGPGLQIGAPTTELFVVWGLVAIRWRAQAARLRGA